MKFAPGHAVKVQYVALHEKKLFNNIHFKKSLKRMFTAKFEISIIKWDK